MLMFLRTCCGQMKSQRGEEGVSRSMSSSSSMEPARSDETWESRAGMVRLREARCTVGAKLEPTLPAAEVEARSESGVAEGKLLNSALPEPDEEDNSTFVERAWAGEMDEEDAWRGVRGALDGGGELGGDDNCISTSATSWASLGLTGCGVLAAIVEEADFDGGASGISTS